MALLLSLLAVLLGINARVVTTGGTTVALSSTCCTPAASTRAAHHDTALAAPGSGLAANAQLLRTTSLDLPHRRLLVLLVAWGTGSA